MKGMVAMTAPKNVRAANMDAPDDDGDAPVDRGADLEETLASMERAVSFAARCVDASMGDTGASAMSSATRRRAGQRAARALREALSLADGVRSCARSLREHVRESASRESASASAATSSMALLADARRAAAAAASRSKRDADTLKAEASRASAADAEAEAARQQLMDAEATISEHESHISSLNSEVASLRDTCFRHKTAVARLTADNLLFVARNREYEASLSAAAAQLTTLQAAAERSQGAWFERMREELETELKGRMERADAETAEHGARAAAAGAEVAVLAERLREANKRASESAEECRRLSRELGEESARQRASAADAAARAQELASETERADSLQAEVRVLTSAMGDTRENVTMYHRERDEAVQRQRELQSTVDETRAAMADALAVAEDARAELASQRLVNEALMRKKEEIEWNYLGVLAKLDRGALAHQPTSRPSMATNNRPVRESPDDRTGADTLAIPKCSATGGDISADVQPTCAKAYIDTLNGTQWAPGRDMEPSPASLLEEQEEQSQNDVHRNSCSEEDAKDGLVADVSHDVIEDVNDGQAGPEIDERGSDAIGGHPHRASVTTTAAPTKGGSPAFTSRSGVSFANMLRPKR